MFSTHLHIEIPSADLDLFEAGVLDSLAFVELLLHLEEEFGIRVPMEELEIDNFRTVRRIAQFVVSRNGKGSPAE
jgi:D-alanine--poly(phosphoribitol) ligase subunit 2